MKPTIYSRSGCVACRQTKKSLDREGIDYEVVDTDIAPEELEVLRAEGWLALPVVKSSVGAWSGFNPDRIEQLVAFTRLNDEIRRVG